MREYGVPFHVVEREWTEDQFRLFLLAIGRRKAKEQQEVKKAVRGRVKQRYT